MQLKRRVVLLPFNWSLLFSCMCPMVASMCSGNIRHTHHRLFSFQCLSFLFEIFINPAVSYWILIANPKYLCDVKNRDGFSSWTKYNNIIIHFSLLEFYFCSNYYIVNTHFARVAYSWPYTVFFLRYLLLGSRHSF